MDETVKDKIFEPFFTTKEKGVGLGLSVCYGIIKAHKGSLQLVSQPGTGTTFKVYIPAQISATTEEQTVQPSVDEQWKGSGTILLAEDEVQLALTVRAMLEELGFNVIVASNGKEALELYHENAADITLVVADIGMPIMNGYEMFRELKKLDPKLPIIISSGFGDDEVTVALSRDAIAGLVSKPYKFDLLRRVLKSVIEGENV